MEYIKVKFTSYNLPLDEDIILRPERTRVITPNGIGIALGAMCYKESKNIAKKYTYLVANSLINARKVWVKKIILLFSYFIKYDSRRDISIAGMFRHFVQYIQWCDSVGLHDVITGDKTRDYEAYRLFSIYLTEKVNTHQLKSMNCRIRQSHIKEIYSEIFEDPHFNVGVPDISVRNDSESIETPCEIRQSKTLLICMSIFDGISDFILNSHPYPFFIHIPKYLEFKDNGFWMVHSNHWFDLSHIYKELPTFKGSVNYVSGNTLTVEDLSKLTGESIELCKRRLVDYEYYRKKANIDLRCSSRLDKARLAMSAFFILFIANTGINHTQAKALEWNDEYIEERTKLGFKTIKYRALGKDVHFEIQSSFMRHFKKYLKLREYINEGSSVNLLFGYQGRERIRAIDITNYVNFVKKLDPKLNFVMPREWRTAKSDWFIRNHDPSTAALALQNTEPTILKNYLAGSHVKQATELGTYLNAISNLGIKIEDGSNNTISAVGHCIEPLHPKQVISLKAIESNCKQPEGCLFCDKYVIHSDEKDIRKLLSCLFCIEQTSHLSASIDDYENIFGPIRNRIGNILKEVSFLSNEHANMVEKIKDEVMVKELLDPYWESKLSMLIEIGVV